MRAVTQAGLDRLNRVELAKTLRAQKRPCPERLHRLFPKPSCWYCGRNGAFERAARIVEENG